VQSFSGSSITNPAKKGARVTFTGCTIAHQVDHQTVESWEYTDYLGLMQQLGMISPPEQSPAPTVRSQ
jgi:predicted ester cyclase